MLLSVYLLPCLDFYHMKQLQTSHDLHDIFVLHIDTSHKADITMRAKEM
jgi:hypothetical protein